MELAENDLFTSIKKIIIQSRLRVFRAANSALLESYWQIGKLKENITSMKLSLRIGTAEH